MATFMAGLLGSKAALSLRATLSILGATLLAAAPIKAEEQPGAGGTPAASPPSTVAPAGQRPSSQQVDADSPASTGFPVTPAPAEQRVPIAEVVVEGLDGHPDRERLERAAYGAMVVMPGNRVSRSELQTDLSAIYATGWFSDVRIQPVDGPLGVRLIVTVQPNPVLRTVTLEPAGKLQVSDQVVTDTFTPDVGKTLNLNTLQSRMQELQKWYTDQGYSLARVTGPSRVNPDGTVVLLVREGTVQGVEVQFINKEGDTTNDKGEPIRGKTKPWVITREVSLKSGDVFNRRRLEEDIKRIYGTGLFSDVKVTLKPVPAQPGEVVVVLGIVEQSTGSISGGVGYSQSQGVFGQIQLQDSNLFGRAWDLGTNVSYGQFGGLGDITFTDPWIKGDRFRTSFRARAFFSREIPQIFQSENSTFSTDLQDFNGADFDIVTNKPRFVGGDDVLVRTNFDTVAIQRVGGNVQFVRPLNGGDPFRKTPWRLILAFGGQEVTPMNFSGDRYTQAVVGETDHLAPRHHIR